MTNFDQLLYSGMAGVMRYGTQGISAQPHHLHTIMAAFLLSWKCWVVAEATHNQPKVLTICPIWQRLPCLTFVNLPSYFLQHKFFKLVSLGQRASILKFWMSTWSMLMSLPSHSVWEWHFPTGTPSWFSNLKFLISCVDKETQQNCLILKGLCQWLKLFLKSSVHFFSMEMIYYFLRTL